MKTEGKNYENAFSKNTNFTSLLVTSLIVTSLGSVRFFYLDVFLFDLERTHQIDQKRQ